MGREDRVGRVDARTARAAWDAWVARAAWDVRTARDASFELSYISITAIGAASLNDNKTASIWLPTLEAFEAGAYVLWMKDTHVFVATIPTVVKVDEQRRLHCETGPAFVWLDGISDYYWRGTNIPPEWITDKNSLTAKAALTWPNLEQRRVACNDIVGWSKILNELDGKVIDADHPSIGTLIEVKLPDLSQPARFNQVLCGTNRTFAYGVPRHINTAKAAQAFRTRKTEAEWSAPEIRT